MEAQLILVLILLWGSVCILVQLMTIRSCTSHMFLMTGIQLFFSIANHNAAHRMSHGTAVHTIAYSIAEQTASHAIL